MRCVGIGGGLSVELVGGGCVRWSVWGFIGRSAMLSMVLDRVEVS